MHKTKKEIYLYISGHAPVTAKQVMEHFDIGEVMTHRHLKRLIENGSIRKAGKPPKVYYFPHHAHKPFFLDDRDFLDKNFLSFSSNGTKLGGSEGFVQRCYEKGLDITNSLDAYKHIIKEVNKHRNSLGFINNIKRFQKQFDKAYIDDLRLLDVYQLKQFGKSKLGNLAYYAKQSHNLNLIKEVISLTKSKIYAFVQANNIDGVLYAPPSLRRQPQFMDELRKGYNLEDMGIKQIVLEKIFAGDVRIPQKSIKGGPNNINRINNAEQTIYITKPQPKVKNLLIIDDFVASGATINICAKKIREKGIAKKIYAIGLLGNIDFSYEVINEV